MSKDKRNPILNFSSPVEEAHVLFVQHEHWSLSIKSDKYDGKQDIKFIVPVKYDKIVEKIIELMKFVHDNVVIE